MDIIDDEGSLFGLINIIDALVLLLVISTVVAGIALVTDSDGIEQPPLDVTVTVESTVHPSVADSLDVGDVIRSDSRIVAELTTVDIAPAMNTTTDAAGNLRLVEHPTDKHVSLELALTPDTSERVLRFQGESVRVGERLSLTFTDVSLDARVIGIDRDERSALA